jgi:hypothetical protein
MPETDFWTFQAKDWLTLAILLVTCWAVYWGPIKAVKVAREEEKRDARTRNKTSVFASLMKTRRTRIDLEHVSALNLIQLYFFDEKSILETYKKYITLLNRPVTTDLSDSLARERDDAFIELAYEIARSLGYAHDRKELQDLAYLPSGWATEQETTKKMQALFIDLLENKRSIGIISGPPATSGSVYPPPPAP